LDDMQIKSSSQDENMQDNFSQIPLNLIVCSLMFPKNSLYMMNWDA
jgi:hypothetical protein